MINNEIIKAGINHDIISTKMMILLAMSNHKDDGVTATEICRAFNVSFSYVSHLLNYFERKGYIITVPCVNKREKRKVLTEQTYQLFRVIGEQVKEY